MSNEDMFCIGPIQLTERDLQEFGVSGLTPLAREILRKSDIHELSALADPDTETAREAARSLGRKCFRLVS